jgi:hypothetical protein
MCMGTRKPRTQHRCCTLLTGLTMETCCSIVGRATSAMLHYAAHRRGRVDPTKLSVPDVGVAMIGTR